MGRAEVLDPYAESKHDGGRDTGPPVLAAPDPAIHENVQFIAARHLGVAEYEFSR